jgi:hypothetical protein
VQFTISDFGFTIEGRGLIAADIEPRMRVGNRTGGKVITKQTVLVLGAGASFPYNYPLGAALLESIWGEYLGDKWTDFYQACGVNRSEREELRSELLLSQKASIDAFLEHRPEFLKVEKIAIALALLSCESFALTESPSARGKGIYHYLYNHLASNWEEFAENKLAVITFNYDRSLEHFLFTALQHSYKKSDAEVASAINCISIIHVHGSLGPLTWQDPTQGTEYAHFGAPNPAEHDAPWLAYRIRKATIASENIKIVSEAQSESSEFRLAFEKLQQAERIYFIGFGYFSPNLERLGIKELAIVDSLLASKIGLIPANPLNAWRYEGRRQDTLAHLRPRYPTDSYKIMPCRGSAFGLGRAEMEAVENEWHIGLPDNSYDSIRFMKECVDLT